MPPGEIAMSCPGCSNSLRIPFAAVRRDNFYCPLCGKKIPLEGVQIHTDGISAGRPKPKKSSRPMRRR